MAKSKEKNRAIELRQRGESIKWIAKKLKVAKGTISLWCRDVKLTPEQIQKLHERMLVGGYKGRLKGARIQYKRRLVKIKEFQKQGLERIGKLSNRDFLIAGVALYWGEGTKYRRDVRIGNSDPEVIKFMIKWFKKIWKIGSKRITLHVGINEIHKNRLEEVENFWSRVTKIPRKQFVKTTLIKAKNKKTYKNFSTYYGTLTIRIKKPADLHYQIMGLIKGLSRRGKYFNSKPGSRLVSKVVS